MADIAQLLKEATSILVVDYPSKEVPESLAQAGYMVVAHEGPGPEEYFAYDSDASSHQVGHAPEHADIVYTHRPLEELPEIVALAKALRAKAVWMQSGRNETGDPDPTGVWMPANEVLEAQKIVEAAGLTLITDAYIADAVTRK